MKIHLSALAILTLLSAAANASITYSYSGPNYSLVFNDETLSPPYDLTMHVTGQVTFSGELAPFTHYQDPAAARVESFSFSDGYQTITSSNKGYLRYFQIDTDGQGRFSNSQWLFDAWLGDSDDTSQPWAFVQSWGFPAGFNSVSVLASGDQAGFRPACPGLRPSQCFDNRAYAAFVGAGTWTVQAIPIPSIKFLFALGAGCIGTLHRKPSKYRSRPIRSGLKIAEIG